MRAFHRPVFAVHLASDDDGRLESTESLSAEKEISMRDLIDSAFRDHRLSELDDAHCIPDPDYVFLLETKARRSGAGRFCSIRRDQED